MKIVEACFRDFFLSGRIHRRGRTKIQLQKTTSKNSKRTKGDCMTNLKLVGLEKKERTVVSVGNVRFGEGFVIIAGPCSVENEEQMVETALAVKEAGADMLRGGAFKPRTSPYAFQGLGLEGLKILAKAREVTGLPFATEVLDTRDVSWVAEFADMIQIGARNMQNFSLLKEVGKLHKPVLLKRGMYSTLEEWMNCAEYIMNEGNPNVVLCERGIRSFETYTRNTLDISAVPAAKELSHLPVITDPTHGTGKVSLIEPMSLASAAAGSDGLIIEVHRNPAEALSDKDQALTPAQFSVLVRKVRSLSKFMEGMK
jgi:3-deoxy-7-phosphoheptulonate synthase